MDGTANEVPEIISDFSGFPTTYFFPANNKTAPVLQFNKERTIKNLVEFAQEYASNAVIAPEIDYEEAMAEFRPKPTPEPTPVAQE